jgi:hypothetical protein
LVLAAIVAIVAAGLIVPAVGDDMAVTVYVNAVPVIELVAESRADDSVYVPAPPMPVPSAAIVLVGGTEFKVVAAGATVENVRFVVYVPTPPWPVPSALIVAVPVAVLPPAEANVWLVVIL